MQTRHWYARVIMTVMTGFLACAASATSLSPEVQAGLTWLRSQVQSDGTLANETDTQAWNLQARQETLLTLRAFGDPDPAAMLPTLLADETHTTEGLARQILAARGMDVAGPVAELLSHQTAAGGFGPALAYAAQPLATAFALQALAVAGQGGHPQAAAARSWLYGQIDAGGRIRVDSEPLAQETAHQAIRALATLPDDAAAQLALTRLAGYLRNVQGSDGAWLDNPYLTALGLETLAATQADNLLRERASQYLRGLQAADGSWAQDAFLTAVILRALANLGGTQPGPGGATATLSGTLRDAALGQPLAGAVVLIAGVPLTTTDLQGRFSLTGLAPGLTTLLITRDGYRALEITVTLVAGSHLSLGDLMAQPSPGQALIRGTVRDAGTGQGLAGVQINAIGGVTYTTHTNAQGAYEITGVEPGALQLHASLAGYHPLSGSTTLNAGMTLDFSPKLVPAADPAPTGAGTLHALVTDPAGQPLAGAVLSLNGQPVATTQADGLLQLELPPGQYDFQLNAPGYGSVQGQLILSAGGTADLGQITLRPATSDSTLQGRILDHLTGQPLAGAQVDLVGTGLSQTTADDGQYRFDHLAGTAWTLRAGAVGYTTAEVAFQVSGPGLYLQDIPLDAANVTQLDIAPLELSPTQVPGQTDVQGLTRLLNTGETTVSGALRVKIYDAQDLPVSDAQVFRDDGQTPLGQIELAPGTELPVVLRWNSAQFAPGAYRFVARFAAAGTVQAATPLGVVLAERQASLTLEGSAALDGTLSAAPPVMRAGTQTVVHLSALLRNSGNTPITSGGYRLRITNRVDGQTAYDQIQTADTLPVNELLPLNYPDWTPAAPGHYDLVLSAADGRAAGAVTGMVYVGDAATAQYTLDKTTVPPGTQTVNGRIHVDGQDVAEGWISHPLAPLIRTAIQKAVTYNDAQASQWTLNNYCLGCHIQTQALVGGVTNDHIATYNVGQRRTLLNSLLNNIQADGNISDNYWYTYHTYQTTLGVWALTAWDGIGEFVSSLYRSIDLLINRQYAAGYWYPDYYSGGVGWTNGGSDTTGVNVSSMIKAWHLYKNADEADLVSYPLRSRMSIGGAGALASDRYGNIYTRAPGWGKLLKIDPAGNTTEIDAGSYSPQGLSIEADGSLLIAGAGGIYKRSPEGVMTKLTGKDAYHAVRAPDGTLYFTGYFDNAIYILDSLGVVKTYIHDDHGLPRLKGIQIDDQGRLIVGDGSHRILRFTSPSQMEVLVSNIQRNSDIQRINNEWWVVNESGVYRFNDDWVGENLISLRGASAITLAPDGTYWVATQANQSVLYSVTPQALNRTTILNRIAGSIRKGADWLAIATIGSNNIELAQQLIGLGEAEAFYRGQPVAATYRAKMEAIGATLRARQQPDGSWTRSTSYTAGDALMTAMVGYALDYLDPPADDPAIDKAIRWVLGRQASDGSWTSANGVYSTRLAATTWVAIWLPIALDRIGGVDTDVRLVLPADIALSQPLPPPDSVTPVEAGGTEYLWKLIGVTAEGRDIDFQLQFTDLLPGETRTAGREAQLIVTNTFTDGPAVAPIALPSVTVQTGLSLTATTDQPQYGPHSPWLGTATVGNQGVGAADGYVLLDILAADDTPVADLGRQDYGGLAPGASLPLLAPWNTGATQPGDYRLRARLHDLQDHPIQTAYAPFTLLLGVPGGGSPLEGAVWTDRAEYGPNDRVHITGRVRNLALNQSLTGLQLNETLTDPTGGLTDLGTRPLPELIPGGHDDQLYPHTLAQAPAGVYTVTQTVRDAAGQVRDTRQASFTVRSSAISGEGLQGTIQATPHEIPLGDPLDLLAGVQNLGNADLSGIPARILLLDPIAETTLAEFPTTLDLARSGQRHWNETWIADGVVDRGHIAALLATVGGQERVLAQDSFILRPPPVQLDVSFGAARHGRLLVLVACQPGEAPNAPGECAQQRKDWLHGYLDRLAIPHTLATTAADFQRELRTGRYTTYWLSGGAEKLDALQAREVREAVNRGEGLLVDGVHDERTGTLDAVTGITDLGKLPPSSALQLAWQDAAGQTRQRPVAHPVSQLIPAGADVWAEHPGTRCKHGQTDIVCPGLVHHGYGQGDALRYAFDLVATLRGRAPDPDLDALFLATLAAATPEPAAPHLPGALLPLRLDLTNLGPAVDLEIRLPLPPEFPLLSSQPAPSGGDAGEGLWTLHLAEADTFTLDLLLHPTPQAGDATLEAVVTARLGDHRREYGRYPLALDLDAAPLARLPELIADAAGLSAPSPQQAQRLARAVDALNAARNAEAAGDPASAIAWHVEAVDHLLSADAVDTTAVRLAIDRRLRALGASLDH